MKNEGCCEKLSLGAKKIDLKCSHTLCVDCARKQLEQTENRVRSFKLLKCMFCDKTTIVNVEIKNKLKSLSDKSTTKHSMAKKQKQYFKASIPKQEAEKEPDNAYLNPFYQYNDSNMTITENNSYESIQVSKKRISAKKQKSGRLVRNRSSHKKATSKGLRDITIKLNEPQFKEKEQFSFFSKMKSPQTKPERTFSKQMNMLKKIVTPAKYEESIEDERSIRSKIGFLNRTSDFKPLNISSNPPSEHYLNMTQHNLCSIQRNKINKKYSFMKQKKADLSEIKEIEKDVTEILNKGHEKHLVCKNRLIELKGSISKVFDNIIRFFIQKQSEVERMIQNTLDQFKQSFDENYKAFSNVSTNINRCLSCLPLNEGNYLIIDEKIRQLKNSYNSNLQSVLNKELHFTNKINLFETIKLRFTKVMDSFTANINITSPSHSKAKFDDLVLNEKFLNKDQLKVIKSINKRFNKQEKKILTRSLRSSVGSRRQKNRQRSYDIEYTNSRLNRGLKRLSFFNTNGISLIK